MAKKDDDASASKGKGDGGSKKESKEGKKGKDKKGKSKGGKDEDNQLKQVLKGQGPAPIYVTIILALIKVWLIVYDCLNYIPYAIFNSPAGKLRKSKRQKAAATVEGDNSSPWRNVDNEDGKLVTEVFPGCDTVDKTWDKMVEEYGDAPCLGTREIIKVHKEKQDNGRVFEKLEQGEYLWESYNEVNERSMAVASGLLDIGHKRNENLVIFAETRAEWMITALGCFRSGIPVVTVYATLGEEAITHAINEVEATTIVTTAELIPKVQSIVNKCNSLKRAIYFMPNNPEADEPDTAKLRDRCEHVLSLDDLEERGEENPADTESPKSSEVALIMYTSGTTGMPKGVMITHANVVAAIAGQRHGVSLLNESDTYIGYLPLAHILEIDAELTVLSRGCRVGYSSPLTLHDRGSKVKKGTHGDCYALQPTMLAAVPAVMDRIFKAVSEEVAASPRIMQEFFRLNYERKRARLEEGYDSPFLDRIVFKRIRSILGGRLRGVLSGGAPLNGETQRFMNICFCCPVIQGYGLTETCGAGTVASMDDLTTGTVGAPVRCCDIMLRDWKEAGYSPENDPPQGEVLIGGPNVAAGYYKNKKKTDEDFIMARGRRWFATGDIGEFRADGSLSIIDRKKDLVKLSHGEYVSLARIETVLLTSKLVDNICVHGNSEHSFLVAFVVPNEKNVKPLAEGTSDWEEVCESEEVNKSVLKELTDHATKNGLQKSEVPAKIYLCSEPWTPDSGLLTEALKLKRRQIAEKYEDELEKMYGGGDDD